MKLERIKSEIGELPETATLVACDVIALYPSVDNFLGIPAVRKLLKEYGTALGIDV